MKSFIRNDKQRWLPAFCLSLVFTLSACGGGGGGDGGGGGGGGNNSSDDSSSSESSDQSSSSSDSSSESSDSSSNSDDSSSDSSSSTPTGNGQTYRLEATVSGLDGELALLVNGAAVTLTDNGTVALDAAVPDAGNYQVTIDAQPVDQTCRIPNAAGTVNADDVLLNITCNEGNSEGYSLVVNISDLAGKLTLSNNGDELIVETDGTYAFPTPVLAEAEYRVTPTHQPAGLVCTVSNGQGTVNNADITDIEVNCGERSLALAQLKAVQTQHPSIVLLPLSVTQYGGVDAPLSGEPVEGLTTEDFEAFEDDSALTTESFFRVDPITNIPFTFDTVLMLDISSSISVDDVEQIKQTARAFIADPQTGELNLQENQRVAIRVFDDTVRAYQPDSDDYVSASACYNCFTEFSRDKDALFQAIEAIARKGSSTNLYGAIIEGASLWSNDFDLDQITYGAMVLVTDGDDTSDLRSQEEAKAAVEFKDFFAVPVGEQINLEVLEDIAGADNIYAANDYSELNNIFAAIDEQLAKQSEGKYLFYYASPSRSGTPELRVEAVNNANTESFFEVVDNFSAAGFSDIGSSREVIVRGSDRVYFDESLTWQVDTRWSNDPANYSWTVTDPNVLLEIEIASDGGSATIIPTQAGEGTVSYTITDNNWSDLSTSGTVTVRPSRIPQNLAAEARNGEVYVHWDVHPDAQQYNVYWSTESGAGKSGTVEQVPAAESNNFTLEEAQNGQSYYFTVTSLIDGVESKLSTEVEATPTLPAPGLFSMTLGTDVNTLSWQPVEGATGYTLYWNTTGNVSTDDNAIELGSDAVNYEHTLPDADSDYYYLLTAKDATSEGLSTEELGVPIIPEITTEAGDRSIELDFNMTEGVTYTLLYSASESLSVPSRQGIGETPFSVTIPNDEPYYFQLEASNSIGTNLSDIFSATALAPWERGVITSNVLIDADFANADRGIAVGSLGTIVLTNDGGANWQSVDSGTSAQLRAVVFADADIAIAAGTSGTLLRSADAGQTWTVITPPSSSDLASLATDGDGNVVAVGAQGSIWHSNDAGESWTERVSGTTQYLETVAFNKSGDTAFAYGYNAGLLTSTDGGLGWTQALPYLFGSGETIRDIQFLDDDTAYAAGRTTTQAHIMKTTDGGANWSVLTVPNISGYYSVSFTDEDHGRIGGNNGYIYVTTDGGETWTQESTDINNGVIQVIHSLDADTVIAVAGQYALRTRAGNHTTSGEPLLLGAWHNVPLDNGPVLYGLSAIAGESAYGVSGSSVYRTDGQGQSWDSQETPTASSLYDTAGLSQDQAIAVGSSGTVITTTDGGENWLAQPSGTTNRLYAVEALDEQTAVAVGANGTVIRTEDGGTSWTMILPGLMASLYDVDFVNATTGFIVTASGDIYRSEDGGQTWTGQSSGVTTSLNAVHMVSETEAYVAGDDGVVLHTVDSGGSWTVIDTQSSVNFQAVAPKDGGIVVVGSESAAPPSVLMEVDENQEVVLEVTSDSSAGQYQLRSALAFSNGVVIATGKPDEFTRFLPADYTR